jgi:signal transduction histidine kinase
MRGDGEAQALLDSSAAMPTDDILEILRLIIRSEPLDILHQRVADTIARSYGVRRVTVGAFDDRTGTFVPRALHGYPPERAVAIMNHSFTLERMKADLKPHLRIGKTCYYVRMEDQTTSYDDSMDYIMNPELVDTPRKSESDWHELDYMDFIMTDRLGNWVGWIEVDDPADGKVPSRECVDGIQMMADLCAVAFENAKAYDVAIGAVADSQAYLEFIVHDIGSKISPLSYFLTSIISKETSEERKAINADNAVATISSMKSLVENIQKYSEIRASPALPRHRYDLKEVLALCSRSVKRKHPDMDLDVKIESTEGPCYAVADELIFDVFVNLLDYSVHSSPTAGADIQIQVEEGHSAITVKIEDHGRGIPDSKKDQVFKRLAWRPDGEEEADLGLSIVALLVERYSGLVSVKDRIQGDHSLGSRFEVSLPKALSSAD